MKFLETRPGRRKVDGKKYPYRTDIPRFYLLSLGTEIIGSPYRALGSTDLIFSTERQACDRSQMFLIDDIEICAIFNWQLTQ
jgi:hypothetical protein